MMFTGKFTGRHMTAILVAFFSVVIAVNAYMATLAVGSFGGTVVDNSYVASQDFNRWIAKGRAEAALGWRSEVGVTHDRHVVLTLAHASGEPMLAAQMDMTARHPLGRTPDIDLRFHADGAGRYVSDKVLPFGRWQLHMTLRSGAQSQHLLQEVD